MCSGLTASCFPATTIVVDPVFDIPAGVGRAEDPLVVGLVLREQQRDFRLAVQEAVAQFGVRGRHRATSVAARNLLQGRLRRARPPGPGIAKPERRQDMKRGGLGPAIAHADLDQDVFRRVLGVLHEYIEVAVARRRHRCPAAHIPCRCGCAACWSEPGRRRERLPEDTCTDTSCTSESACCPGRSNTP